MLTLKTEYVISLRVFKRLLLLNWEARAEQKEQIDWFDGHTVPPQLYGFSYTRSFDPTVIEGGSRISSPWLQKERSLCFTGYAQTIPYASRGGKHRFILIGFYTLASLFVPD